MFEAKNVIYFRQVSGEVVQNLVQIQNLSEPDPKPQSWTFEFQGPWIPIPWHFLRVPHCSCPQWSKQRTSFNCDVLPMGSKTWAHPEHKKGNSIIGNKKSIIFTWTNREQKQELCTGVSTRRSKRARGKTWSFGEPLFAGADGSHGPRRPVACQSWGGVCFEVSFSVNPCSSYPFQEQSNCNIVNSTLRMTSSFHPVNLGVNCHCQW